MLSSRALSFRTACAVVVPLLALSACSSSRPTTEELVTGLTASGSRFPVAEQQAECAAELLLGSDLSDDALQAVADPSTDTDLSTEDRRALAALQLEVLTDCTG